MTNKEAINLLDNLIGMVDDNQNSDYDQALHMGINLLKAEPQWISCSETVDIPDHEILACDKYGEEMFGYLVYEDEQWLCGSDGCVMYDPIAWREKPEPYKENNNE